MKVIMVAEYECECGYKWKSKNFSGGSGFCRMCHKDVEPYNYRPATEKVHCMAVIVLSVLNLSSYNSKCV